MRVSILVALFSFSVATFSQTQSWIPSVKGILDSQQTSLQLYGFSIQFKSNGPFGKDWIFGHWLDSDTLIRHVGYREGGEWKSLPFYTIHPSSYTSEIIQYGDTMYIGGLYGVIYLDSGTTTLSNTTATILKYWPDEDSIWTSDAGMVNISDFDVNGDTLVVSGNYYLDTSGSTKPLPQYTTDGGVNWTYPYTYYPTTNLNFGAGPFDDVEIKDGKFYTLNNQGANPVWDGVIMWDGSQWHNFGNGIRGTYSTAMDLIFFRDSLYMAGSFTKTENELNPGEFIVRWTGAYWESVGGGAKANQFDVMANADRHMLFEYDNVLYCKIGASEFGDAPIPVFAGWDGKKWCGTPFQPGDDGPKNFGFVNDTLWSFYPYKNATAIGKTVSYLNYFDGDYLHGPNSICSTPGLGEEKVAFTNEEVKVYPNPVKDELHVSLPDDIKEAAYQLMELDGKLVKDGKLKAGGNTLTVSEKLNGVFLLKLSSFGGEIVRKVVFEN